MIIKMVSRNELIGVINHKIVVEVLHVLRNPKNKNFASLSFSFLEVGSNRVGDAFSWGGSKNLM